MKYLGIIPARKGSKRLPGKNTKNLSGKPLIEWTIQAAKSSVLENICLSTDSTEILKIGEKYGLLYSSLRPDHLAQDGSSSLSVVQYVVEMIESKGEKVENIVLLQPTSPLRTSIDIDNAISLFEAKKMAVQSYSPAECPPEWCCRINTDLSLPRNHQIGRKSSQELGTYHRINGAIYVISKEELFSTKTFVPPNSCAYIMPRERGIDIDENIDFKIAETLLQSNS